MIRPICAPRSFLGGAPPEGNKTVRLVYVDEAGFGRPDEEPFLVVGGVIVNADTILNGIENQLERLIERHIPVT